MSIIGREKRNTIPINETIPGPGQYNPLIDKSSQNHGQPKWSIHGTKTREIPIIKGIPGPGQYEQKSTLSSRAPIICGRYRISDREERQKPGPAEYRTDISALSKIGFSIGKGKRDLEKQSLSPGPGTYEAPLKKNIPSYIIGKESRSQKDMTNPVGPGAYNLPTMFRTGKGFHIVPRRERIYSTDTPGPNQYNQLLPHKGKGFKIGQSKREGLEDRGDSPGPAFYEPKKAETSIGFSIGKSKKLTHRIDSTPGPGDYEPVKKNTAPQFSILSRYVQKCQSIGPGPSAYTLSEMRDTRNVVFGHSKREFGSVDQIPGPGQYQQEIKQSNTAIVFGREKRSYTKIEDVPGPGQYRISSMFEHKKKR